MSRPAVAVTGVGVVSPIGFGREQFWSALCAGRSGVGPLEGVALGGPPPAIAAEVRGFAPREFIASENLRRMGKLARMIVAASRMALDDARLAAASVRPERLGICIGSAIGAISDSETYLEKVLTRGPASASPLLFPNLVHNSPASYVAMELGAMGTNVTVVQGEVSGEEAVIQGCQAIRAGRADVVLAGGGDELGRIFADTCRLTRTLSGQRGGVEWCSPYDRERNGLVLGEGAAVLVLEPIERARARAAAVFAVIEGEASFAVPSSLYDWPADASAAAPILDGLLGAGDVDLVCGAANSSRRVDACELALFSRVFGARGATAPIVTSIKGAIGEFGAAGALTLAAACLAVREQGVPSLCHLGLPEPSPLHFAGRTGTKATIRRVLALGLSRGGAGAALVLGRG